MLVITCAVQENYGSFSPALSLKNYHTFHVIRLGEEIKPADRFDLVYFAKRMIQDEIQIPSLCLNTTLAEYHVFPYQQET